MNKHKNVLFAAFLAFAITLTFFACSSGGSGDSGGTGSGSGNGSKNWCYIDVGAAKACTYKDNLGAMSCDQLQGEFVDNCTDYGFEYCNVPNLPNPAVACTAVPKGQCPNGAEIVDNCDDIINPGKGGNSSSSGEGNGGGSYPKTFYCAIQSLEYCIPENIPNAAAEEEARELCADLGGTITTTRPSYCGAGGNDPSSSSGAKQYCDYGPYTVDASYNVGGGCFEYDPIEGCRPADGGRLASQCGRTDLQVCDYGPPSVYGGGCFLYNGICSAIDGGTIKNQCGNWINQYL